MCKCIFFSNSGSISQAVKCFGTVFVHTHTHTHRGSKNVIEHTPNTYTTVPRSIAGGFFYAGLRDCRSPRMNILLNRQTKKEVHA
jgi:hypothetical protein